MKSWLLALVLLAGSAPQSVAATIEPRGYTVTIEPGRVYEQEMSCTEGKLLSGGYTIADVNRGEGPFRKVVVIANTPFTDKSWFVRVYNDHDAPVLVEFRMEILCD